MKRTSNRIAAVSAFIGPAVAVVIAGTAPTTAKEPCAALRLGGAKVMEIPCPEGLDRLLEVPPRESRPGDSAERAIDPEMAIDPGWPHDRAMVTERDWPHDRAMVAPRRDEQGETAPLLDDLLGLFGRFLSRGPEERPPLNPHPRRAGYADSVK